MSDHDHASHDHADHGAHHGPTSFWTKYVFSTDHKVIGLQFMFTSLLFVLLGGLLALGVRYQIAWPNQNVPYHLILPGKMTNLAPEANLAAWKVGGEVVLNSVLKTEDGQTFPKGAVAQITGFPGGIAVTLPVGLEVRKGDGEPTTRLSEPVDAFIEPAAVMADYNYSKTEALTSVGANVTVPDRGQWSIRGLSVPAVGGGLLEKAITLPIRSAATKVALKLRNQTLEADGKNIEVKGGSVTAEAAPLATSLTYYKHSLTTNAYLSLFTMHASIMIFFVIIPMLVGTFGNFLVPLMIGARDMAFPKLNALSFWLSVPAGLVMIASFWTPEGSAGGGWTMYPTLSTFQYSPQLGTTLWVVAVGLVGFSSVVGALNYITTTINMRAPGMTMFRMPLTVWAILITATLALFSTPVLTAAMILLTFDRLLGTMFFIPKSGGQPIMWQHLFWFYSHPAVYIMILPAMGVVSDILATFSRKPIFGYKPMVFAICAIAGLGFIVWGHHMFQSGMNPVLGTTFMASTVMIALPSAIKTFNWLGTIWGGNIKFTPPMLFALGFVSMFVIGGLSGIFMASAPIDIHIHDTYFIVAHIHYVLFGGSIFGIFAGVYYWYPKMFGRQMNQTWGTIHFWMTIIAFNGTFFLMHVLGIGGHPRRYASIMEYPSLQHLQPLNVVMTIFAMMLGMAQLPFMYNFFVSLPRRLGRAIIALFACMLIVPAVIGLLMWASFDGTGPFSLINSFVTHGQTVGFTSTATILGNLTLIVVMVGLTISMAMGLKGGSRVASVLVNVPLTIYFLAIMAKGSSLAWPEQTTADSPLYMHTVMLLKQGFWSPFTAHFIVALGLGLLAAAVITAAVFVIWAIGGALKLPALLQRVLWLVFLPAFLAPMVLKHDTYILLHLPTLFESRWIILAALAIPGLLHLVVRRPKDLFGYAVDANPWHANSLEWATTSPPPFTNFDAIPVVYRGPYEFSSPVVEEDYLPQPKVLPAGVVEPSGH